MIIDIQQIKNIFEIKSEATEESVIDFILNTKIEIKKVTEGKIQEGEIQGVYCDIDNTIFDKKNKKNIKYNKKN